MGAAYQLDRESMTLAAPVELNCKFKPDPELVLKCQAAGMRPLKGTPIGKISNLYPIDTFKRTAMEEAKTFVGYMKQQGYSPREAESEMEIWGPFRESVDMSKGASMENFEEGNDLIPEGKWRTKAHSLWAPPDSNRGPRVLNKEEVLHSQDYKRGLAFIIRGKFLASRGHEDEETGTLLVGG